MHDPLYNQVEWEIFRFVVYVIAFWYILWCLYLFAYTWFMDLIRFVSIYMLSELVYMIITAMGCHNIITSNKNIVQIFICSQRSNFLWLLSLAKTPRCCPVLEFWTIPLVPRVERVRVRQGQARDLMRLAPRGSKATPWLTGIDCIVRDWWYVLFSVWDEQYVCCKQCALNMLLCMTLTCSNHEHSMVADLNALVAHVQALSLHVCQMP